MGVTTFLGPKILFTGAEPRIPKEISAYISLFLDNYYPLARMRSKGYSSRLVCLSFVRSVCLLGGSVSVHSTSTRTWIAFIGQENHAKLNRFSS